MKNPFLKFYTSDWRSDPALRMCSLAARGLWLEMICLMHEATPYGHLLVNGHPVTDAQLGALVGATPDQITALLGELDSAGVFSRTRAGVIYSRKLTRMAKKAATARNNGRTGGNPTLSKQNGNRPLVKGMDKGGDKPQKPEARSQKLDITPKPPSGDFDLFWKSYPQCKRKTDKPKAKVAFEKITAGKHPHIDQTEPEKIVSGVKAFADSKPDPEYIPLPTTWLNGERWNVAYIEESERAKRYRALAK